MPDSQEQIEGEAPANGSVAAGISNAIVRLTREYTGRGPTKARTTISENLVVVLMADTLLKAERTLATKGEGAMVCALRQKFQQAMEDDLIATVEEHSGRKVSAFMSGNHIDPDMGVEIFVLEPV